MTHFGPRDGDRFQSATLLCGSLECRFSFRATRAVLRMPSHRQALVFAARDEIARAIVLRSILLGLAPHGGLGNPDAAWIRGQFPDMHYHGSVWLRMSIAQLPLSLLITDVGFVSHA